MCVCLSAYLYVYSHVRACKTQPIKEPPVLSIVPRFVVFALGSQVVDPDAEARREQGASQQRSLYHVSRIVTMKRGQSEAGSL